MAKLKRWLLGLWCWITGGHTYSDINLHTYYDCCEDKYTFRNKCLKCGKVNKWEVPAKPLLEYALRMDGAEYGNHML